MDNHFNFLFNNKYNIHWEKDSRGIAWFFADEIANYLGYTRSSNMARMIPESDKIVININNPIVPEIGLNMFNSLSELNLNHSLGGRPETIIISESGVYQIALNANSNRQEVIEFRDFVLKELLPSIRMYGCYFDRETREALNENPNLIHDLNDKIAKLSKKRMYHLLPRDRYPYNTYENFRNTLCASTEDITIGTLAKILCNVGYPTGEHRLYEELRNDGFLIKFGPDYNKPYQTMIDGGLMKIAKDRNYSINNSDVYYTVYVTPKGQDFFISYFTTKMENSKIGGNN